MISDKKLAMEIVSLRERAENLRQSLYDYHSDGCVCEPDHVCAFHAEINNLLVNITDSADDAIRRLEKPGEK